jgi:hypothetical protein
MWSRLYFVPSASPGKPGYGGDAFAGGSAAAASVVRMLLVVEATPRSAGRVTRIVSITPAPATPKILLRLAVQWSPAASFRPSTEERPGAGPGL